MPLRLSLLDFENMNFDQFFYDLIDRQSCYACRYCRIPLNRFDLHEIICCHDPSCFDHHQFGSIYNAKQFWEPQISDDCNIVTLNEYQILL